MNIRIAIADVNEEYAQRLTDGLLEDTRFMVSMFTDPDAFAQATRQKCYEVLLLDKSMLAYSGQSQALSLLLVDASETDSAVLSSPLHKINKYQRISEIVRYMLDIYGECSKGAIHFGDKAMKIAAFFAPAGGCGVSTLAASYAMSQVKNGKKVLYISLEDFPSTASLFGTPGGKGLSEVFAKLGSDINFAAKLQSLLHVAEEVMFFNPFDSLRDLLEVTPEEITEFLALLAKSELCDMAVLDMGHSLSAINLAVMEKASQILIPTIENELPAKKLSLLLSQPSFLEAYAPKLLLLANRDARISETHGIEVAAQIPEVPAKSSLERCQWIVHSGCIQAIQL